MKALLIISSAYLFLCYGFSTKPTPEGILLVFATTFIMGTFSVASSNREVSIYFTREQIEDMLEDDYE
jgi:hypothetical protein